MLSEKGNTAIPTDTIESPGQSRFTRVTCLLVRDRQVTERSLPMQEQ